MSRKTKQKVFKTGTIVLKTFCFVFRLYLINRSLVAWSKVLLIYIYRSRGPSLIKGGIFHVTSTLKRKLGRSI